MKKTTSVRAFALLLCLLLLCPLVLTGCSGIDLQAETERTEQMCEKFVSHVLHNEKKQAYALVADSFDYLEFNLVWEEMRKVLYQSESFTLTLLSAYYRKVDKEEYSEVSFELTTDNGKLCRLDVVLYEEQEVFSYFAFLDATQFAADTAYLEYVNYGLIALSVLMIAFTVWMLIDCLRRNLRKKWLWVLVVLIGVSLSITVGEQDFNFYFGLGLLIHLCTVSSIPTELAIEVLATMPLGSIIYFILRKRLPPKPVRPAYQMPPQGGFYPGAQPYGQQPFYGQQQNPYQQQQQQQRTYYGQSPYQPPQPYYGQNPYQPQYPQQPFYGQNPYAPQQPFYGQSPYAPQQPFYGQNPYAPQAPGTAGFYTPPMVDEDTAPQPAAEQAPVTEQAAAQAPAPEPAAEQSPAPNTPQAPESNEAPTVSEGENT